MRHKHPRPSNLSYKFQKQLYYCLHTLSTTGRTCSYWSWTVKTYRPLYGFWALREKYLEILPLVAPKAIATHW
jgi:hypothetical protein